MSFTMQVYIELALAENFCMDFCLFYAAKKATKNLCSFKRIALSSALGSAFAVIFPLLNLQTAVSLIIKIASGFALCAVCGKYTKFKGYLKFAAAYFGFTFLLGGALIAVFSFFNISYESGGGFLISSVPIGIPLFIALILAFAIKKIFAKITANNSKNSVSCHIYVGQLCAQVNGFFDSGNKVYYKGQPVSVIPKHVAKKIINEICITESVKIHTVTGSKALKVFTADKIEISTDDKLKIIKNVKIGISPTYITQAVLHPDLSEVN